MWINYVSEVWAFHYEPNAISPNGLWPLEAQTRNHNNYCLSPTHAALGEFAFNEHSRKQRPFWSFMFQKDTWHLWCFHKRKRKCEWMHSISWRSFNESLTQGQFIKCFPKNNNNKVTIYYTSFFADMCNNDAVKVLIKTCFFLL